MHPDDSYHGITYAERFGKEGAFITKATAQLMRDFGSMQSPMNAYIAEPWSRKPARSDAAPLRQRYGGGTVLGKPPQGGLCELLWLESSPYHALAQKYLPNGSCGVVSFGLAGGRQAASTFMKELKLAAIETHVPMPAPAA